MNFGADIKYENAQSRDKGLDIRQDLYHVMKLAEQHNLHPNRATAVSQ